MNALFTGAIGTGARVSRFYGYLASAGLRLLAAGIEVIHGGRRLSAGRAGEFPARRSFSPLGAPTSRPPPAP